MNSLMRNILLKRSVYSFSANLLREEDLMAILEEGKQLSNVASNGAWYFTAIQNKVIMKSFAEISEFFAIKNGTDDFLANRSVIKILDNISTLLVISGSGDIKYTEDAANTLFGSMMLAADSYGVKSCWLGTRASLMEDNATAIAELLQIPDEYTPLCVGGFGYPIDDDGVKVTYMGNVAKIIR
ncbi:MAG: nitroreductase family protein [Anaerovibrio sp.]|uniref:nitroreductase family protein n=1 Tax=Anaerovibrio sp. TaxID=1872532 RepID=UPI0025F5C98E|nr:nitroreductase family protein [Anaerovibrio sp.]MCR5176418.1 nitroreductase family protein [Anaerovibrio sp.]